MIPLRLLTDRSRMVAYRNCPRFRFLRYHDEGTGWERKTLSLPLANGIFVHDVLAEVLRGKDPIAAIDASWARYVEEFHARGMDERELGPVFLAEQRTLLEGLVRAWCRARLPVLRWEYEIVLVEREILWPMGEGIEDMIRCDALLRRKRDGMLFYLEFKTLSRQSDDWVKQWEHNSQLLLNVLGVEEVLGERLGGVLIEGITKGKREKDTLKTSPYYGTVIQNSPLCYPFRGVDTRGNPVYSPTWQRDYTRVRIWEEPEMTVERWVEQLLPIEDLRGLFVPVPPIRPNNRQLERHRRQAVWQEAKIARALADLQTGAASRELILDLEFPQNDDHCFRYWGRPCEMEDLCFDEGIATDPEGSGLYQRRRPHHEAEVSGGGNG